MADQRCGTCARGFYRSDNGMVCCGAPVDQDALLDGDKGVNAIWAERKYSPLRMLGLAGVLAGAAGPAVAAKVAEEPEGSDCENMHPTDGAACKMWKAHPEVAGVTPAWCKTCGVSAPHDHLHDTAHGIAGTHMAGSERYECTKCRTSIFKAEGEKLGLSFVMD